MIISKISGGLGNQLFQYAVGKAAALASGAELKFDLSFYDEQEDWLYELDHFCIGVPRATPEECLSLKFRKPSTLTRIKWALLRQEPYSFVPARTFCLETKLNTFDSRVLNSGPNSYLDGLWQTEMYFDSISDTIRQEVRLRNAGSPAFRTFAETIQNTPSICIHVRRGDYLNHSIFATCTLDYYQRAIAFMSSVVVSPTYFVFSNDITWCRDNLTLPASSVFVGSDLPLPPHEDLMLMSLCKHNITANSTFSWWGGWLNRNPDKVVCTPRQWHCNGRQTHDTIPEKWVKIDL